MTTEPLPQPQPQLPQKPQLAPGEPPSLAYFKRYMYDRAMGSADWFIWERDYMRARLEWLEKQHAERTGVKYKST